MRVAAFQNGYFVALCNRLGPECLTFAGESFVCAPDGTVLARAARSVDTVLLADVDLSATRTVPGESRPRRDHGQGRDPRAVNW